MSRVRLSASSTDTPYPFDPFILSLLLGLSTPFFWFAIAVGLHRRFFRIFTGICTFLRIGGRKYPYVICLAFFWFYLSPLLSKLGGFRLFAYGQVPFYKTVFTGFFFLIGGVLTTTIVAALILVYKNTGQPLDD